MAHKSKTQRAKAQAAKANRKEREARDEASGLTEAAESEASKASAKAEAKKADAAQTKAIKKEEKKPVKKKRFQFLRDVKAEMTRVTWPTRQDVIRWSGVVVAALLFFGIFTGVLDNLIITPILVALSGLGA